MPRARDLHAARGSDQGRRHLEQPRPLRALHGAAARGGRDGHGGVAPQEDLPHLPRGRPEVGAAPDAQRPHRPALLPAHVEHATRRDGPFLRRRLQERDGRDLLQGLHPRDHPVVHRTRQAVHSRASGRSAERDVPPGRRADRDPRRRQRGGRVVLPGEPRPHPGGRLPPELRDLRLRRGRVHRDAAVARGTAAVRGGDVPARDRLQHQLASRRRRRHRLRLLRAVAYRGGAEGRRRGRVRSGHQAHVRNHRQDGAVHGGLADREHHLLGLLPDEVPGQHGAPAGPAPRVPPDGRAHVHPADGVTVPPAFRGPLRRGAAAHSRRGSGRGSDGSTGGRRGPVSAPGGQTRVRGERGVAMIRVLAVFIAVVIGVAANRAGAEVAPGTTIDQSTADQVKDLLPPEILKHYKNGEYVNRAVDFPNGRFRWDDGFDQATRQNGETPVLDENKQPVDRSTHKRPDYLTGIPLPTISESDPDGGTKVLWNLAYAYYTGGNSHNWTNLNWLSRTGVQRSAVQDVYFLYYDGQPRHYSPKSNPENLLFQFLAVTATPADIQGTAALGYRYRDPAKRDLSWAYVPALRRVRAVSPANRSDGFLGSDQSQDDGFFFDGKPEDFTWKITGHREQMRLVDPDSIDGKIQRKELPGGGWRTIAYNNDKSVGFLMKDWKGVAWAPAGAGLAKRKFWVLEGVPKDKYYLYGKIELWIDDETWQGAWNRKCSWQGDLLNVYEVMGFASHDFNPKERWYGSTMAYQGSENIKADRATVSGQNGPGADPANDRRVPLEPSFFDYQTLNRFGK